VLVESPRHAARRSGCGDERDRRVPATPSGTYAGWAPGTKARVSLGELRCMCCSFHLAENRNSAQANRSRGSQGEMEKSSGARHESPTTDTYLPAAIVLDLPRERGEHCSDQTAGGISPIGRQVTEGERQIQEAGHRGPRNQKALAAKAKMFAITRCFLERRPSRFLTRSEATSFNLFAQPPEIFPVHPRGVEPLGNMNSKICIALQAICPEPYSLLGACNSPEAAPVTCPGITTNHYFPLCATRLNRAFDMLEAAQFGDGYGDARKRGGHQGVIAPETRRHRWRPSFRLRVETLSSCCTPSHARSRRVMPLSKNLIDWGF